MVKNHCILNNIGVHKVKLYAGPRFIETNPFLSALGETLSTIHVFINTHGLIKGCLNEDLILAYVLNKRRGGV